MFGAKLKKIMTHSSGIRLRLRLKVRLRLCSRLKGEVFDAPEDEFTLG